MTDQIGSVLHSCEQVTCDKALLYVCLPAYHCSSRISRMEYRVVIGVYKYELSPDIYNVRTNNKVP